MVNYISGAGLVFIATLLLSVKTTPTAGPYFPYEDVDRFQAGSPMTQGDSEIGLNIDGRDIMRRGDIGDDGNGMWVDRRVVGNGGHAWQS
jgi:hypothetical protein